MSPDIDAMSPIATPDNLFAAAGVPIGATTSPAITRIASNRPMRRQISIPDTAMAKGTWKEKPTSHVRHPPDCGRISVGKRILFDSEGAVSIPAHKRRVGYVFQEAILFPHMTVRKKLDYGRRMNGRERDPGNEERVAALLEIGHPLDRGPDALSGSEKQRVAIGMALLLQPKWLLLDEPLASLDSARKDEILPYLKRLRDSGIPMLYVSHAIAEVERIADTIVYLRSGRVVRTTTDTIETFGGET